MRILLASAVAAFAFAGAALPADAAPLTVTAPVDVSIPSPFAPGCGGPTEASAPGRNFNYENAETEPWLAVSPTNAALPRLRADVEGLNPSPSTRSPAETSAASAGKK